ncbi:galactose oxidase [Prochlorococcus sp. MIT 1201]|uniref:galactose oxidase n=1 Tax=Prochlorococcus sp. MIT 1201 TaxID=3082535 RepID=UPI0039A4E674
MARFSGSQLSPIPSSDPEEWQCMDEGTLKTSRSGAVCMTCNHFRYAVGKQCQTLLTCPIHQRLIPQGEHLNSKCHQWIIRRELEVGWAPEVA